MYVIPFMLGESALRHQNWERAAEDLQRCLQLNPNFDNAMTGLARALAKLGRVDEAKSWLRKALESNPENYRAWYETGLFEAANDPAAAQANYAQAAAHLQRAAELGIKDAPLYNFLGIAYSRTGRVQQAVESYRKALAADPDLADAHLNLAYAYQTLSQPGAARTEYETACRLQKDFCQYVPGDRP
jgi:Flp pilus assembly protein TadD